MRYAEIEVRPLAGALGAEISGVDLAAPLSEALFGEIHRAFLEHLVIFFHHQKLTPGSQRDFAARFGPPGRYPFAESMPDHPEVIEIVKEEHEKTNFGEGWHSDTTYLERPPMATCLLAKETPPFGGDTQFANMYLAYETLSAGMKAMLDGLIGHSSASLKGRGRSARQLGDNTMQALNLDRVEDTFAEHPVVRTHPETGRKALYLNRLHTNHF